MRRVKEYKDGDDLRITVILMLLDSSLKYAETINAPKLAEKIRLAISSAKGARRNVGYRRINAELKKAGIR